MLPIVWKLIFLVTFFLLLICQGQEEKLTSRLTREEKKDLEYFLRYLCIRDAGVFVLFGSKPFCDGGFLEDVEQKRQWPYERSLIKGWEAWEKVSVTLQTPHYVLVKKVESVSLEWPDHRVDNRIVHHFILADIAKTALILAEHYDTFRTVTGMDFHPLQIVFDLKNPDSIFWNRVFSRNGSVESHIALGLLYGFGKNNARLFAWQQDPLIKDSRVTEFFKSYPLFPTLNVDSHSMSIEELFDRRIGSYKIPGFMAMDNDSVLEKYREEKIKIEKIYRGKNFAEITLRALSRGLPLKADESNGFFP
jgi:hypothetical protein